MTGLSSRYPQTPERVSRFDQTEPMVQPFRGKLHSYLAATELPKRQRLQDLFEPMPKPMRYIPASDSVRPYVPSTEGFLQDFLSIRRSILENLEE